MSFLTTSTKTSICYVLDIGENEPTENGEKEEAKEKDVFEEGQLTDQSDLLILNYLTQNFYPKSSENSHFSPYFEVCSPPPELV